jgi:hypothetical protein
VRSFTAVGEKAIGTNGFFLFGVLTLIMAILKLTVITDWSWWRVSLPIVIFVGFNMVYILVGFIYLSLVNIREGSPEDETAFPEDHHQDHHRIPHDWISLLLFALFADNLVRWWEGAEGSYWFWLLSGQIEAVLIFAGLSVADLFLYWSRIGPTLGGSE